MKVSQLLEIIDSIAPLSLAQQWDNVGLLVGDADSEVNSAMLAVDVTNSVVDEAIENDCNTIIGYHPVIWDPLKRVTKQTDRAVVYKLLHNGINVISIHTALDAAIGGVNDALAETLQIANPKPLGDYVYMPYEDYYKLAVFIPSDSVDKVSEAVFAAGAGSLGNYSKCGFRSYGEGSFMPLEGSRPAIGSQDTLKRVEEVRFETIVKDSRLEEVVAAMKTAHPYEMPAYDVVKLSVEQQRLGIGRFGELSKKRKVSEIVSDIKQLTGVEVIGFIGEQKESVSSGAVCAGSCGSVLNKVIAEGCDIYITGELKHHDALAAQEAGLLCLCLGHSFSERFILRKVQDKIDDKAPDLTLLASKKDKDPFSWQRV